VRVQVLGGCANLCALGLNDPVVCALNFLLAFLTEPQRHGKLLFGLFLTSLAQCTHAFKPKAVRGTVHAFCDRQFMAFLEFLAASSRTPG
jgi:hypothetical protein